VTTILHVIQWRAKEKDLGGRHGAERLRGAILRFKRQLNRRPWTFFQVPEQKRDHYIADG